MVPPVRITGPAQSPVSLDQIKKHTRAVDFSDDDEHMEALVNAAVAYCDGYAGILGRCLVEQVWRQDHEMWKASLSLPFPDVSAATVKYFDADGAEQTLDAGLYQIVNAERGSKIVFKDAFSRPSLDSDRELPVSVTFTAGYGAPESVPWPLRVAIMQLATHWYEQRGISGDAETLPFAFNALIAPYRRVAP